ncbi:MAG: glycoside hydrolase [Saprospiraceae bacterium]|nr:glycoside hydrolase [Saprospiraceae bacterium]
MSKFYCLALLMMLAACANAQTQPIPNSPANGSAWTYLGPHATPIPGKGAGWSSTGTGAEIRVKFRDSKATNPRELYTATPTGGLFRTDLDLAEGNQPRWENLTDSTRLPVLGVKDFEFSYSDPNTIYIGAGVRYPLDYSRTYGIGLLKTTDGGRTWQETGLKFTPPGDFTEVVHDILLHPTSPDTIHVICGKDYYRSDDAGTSFTLKNTNPHPGPAGWQSAFRAILAKPGSPQTLYLTEDGPHFFMSKNSGETWSETVLDSTLGVTEGVMRVDMAVSERSPELVYLAVSGRKNEFILRSLDGGGTWQFILKKNLSGSYEKHVFALSPNDDNRLYVGGLYVHEVKIDTTGKATTKQITASNVHLDHRELHVVADGQGGDIIYSANDGGLYRAVFDGKKWDWQDVSGTGLNNMQLYGLAVAEDYSVLPAGTQDLGTVFMRPDGTATKPNLGGDGSDCAVDPYNSANIFSVTWGGGAPTIYRSTDGGEQWSRWNKGIVNNGDRYYHPIFFHENGSLYMGSTKVHYLPYGSDTWRQVGDINLPTKDPWRVTAMSVAADDNTIYAYGDQLYRTDNARADSAAVWEPLGKNMGEAVIFKKGGNTLLAVECDPEVPSRIWVSFNNFDKKFKVYFSADGGNTWSNLSRGLPKYPVTSLLAQAGTDDVLYAGTDVGVFVNFDASNPESAWQPFSAGLPVCMVADLEVNYCFGKLVAGTHGRSVWESPLAVPSVFETVEVGRDTSWDFRLLRSDVVVKSGTTLTLRGEVRIAEGKKIIVEKDAQLVLDGAHLSDLCGQPWSGIERGEGSRGFLGLLFVKKAGEVTLLNGATVKGMRDEEKNTFED